MVIAVLGAAVAFAVVLWFVFGRSPEQAATHEGQPLAPGRRAGRDLAGPADAGAEDMGVPSRGDIGPQERPR